MLNTIDIHAFEPTTAMSAAALPCGQKPVDERRLDNGYALVRRCVR